MERMDPVFISPQPGDRVLSAAADWLRQMVHMDGEISGRHWARPMTWGDAVELMRVKYEGVLVVETMRSVKRRWRLVSKGLEGAKGKPKHSVTKGVIADRE